jgi:phage-related protein
MWEIDLSEEVHQWHTSLSTRDRGFADRALDRLAERGPNLAMPHSRALGGGLRELRFTCEGVARRITYYLDTERMVFVLTTFRKQRNNERREVDRARRAMNQAQAERRK